MRTIVAITLMLTISITSLAAEIDRQMLIYIDDDKPDGATNFYEDFWKAYETDHFVVYTDDDYENSDIDMDQVQRVITAVTPDYLDMVSRFGEPTDVNADGKLAIVFHDLTGNYNGLFRSSTTWESTNFLDMIQINDKYIEGDWSDEYAISLILHEAQHALFYNNAAWDYNIINEGLSVFVEDYYVPGYSTGNLDQHFAFMDDGRDVDYHNYHNNLVLFRYLFDEKGGWNTLYTIQQDDTYMALQSIMNSIGYDINNEADSKEFFTDYMHWMLTWNRIYEDAQRPAPITGASESNIDVEQFEYVVRWIQPNRTNLELTLASGNSKIEYVVEELSFSENVYTPEDMVSVRSYDLAAGTHELTLSDSKNVLAITPIFYDNSVATTWSYSYTVSNEAPTATNDNYQVNEKTTLNATTVLSNDSDIEDVVLTEATLVSDVSNGTLIFNNDGTFTYVPENDFIGNDSFTYSVEDSNGATDTATVTITVIDVPNTLPVVTLNGAASINLLVGQTYNELGATATDAEDGSLEVVITGDSVVTTSPAALNIIYTATDSEGGQGTATRTINVTLGNAPVINIGSATVELKFGESFEEDVTAVDVEDGSLEVDITGTVNSNVAGVYELTYSVTDSQDNTSTATRTVTVKANNAPVVTIDGTDMTVDYASSFSLPVATAMDDEDGEIFVEMTGNANPLEPGTYTITYTATDSAGASDSKQITVTVRPMQEDEEDQVVVEDPEEVVEPEATPEPEEEPIVEETQDEESTTEDETDIVDEETNDETVTEEQETSNQDETTEQPESTDETTEDNQTESQPDTTEDTQQDDTTVEAPVVVTPPAPTPTPVPVVVPPAPVPAPAPMVVAPVMPIIPIVPVVEESTNELGITEEEFASITVEFADTENLKVRRLASKGIINGKGEGKFDPKGYLTRAELATLLVRALNIDTEVEGDSFTDVSSDAWYYQYVLAAKAAGLVNGMGDGTFDPLAQVRTQDAMIMISRVMANYKGEENTSEAHNFVGTSGYASAYVSHLVELGFVDEKFTNGMVNINREEMAELVYSMYFFGE